MKLIIIDMWVISYKYIRLSASRLEKCNGFSSLHRNVNRHFRTQFEESCLSEFSRALFETDCCFASASIADMALCILTTSVLVTIEPFLVSVCSAVSSSVTGGGGELPSRQTARSWPASSRWCRRSARIRNVSYTIIGTYQWSWRY